MASINQICFTNEVSCVKFKGHMLKPNICVECQSDISRHNSSVVTESDVLKALETTQKGEKIPSLILDEENGYGRLYLGGFKAAINKDFIKEENVKGILNTAGESLFALFGKKLKSTYESVVESEQLNLLCMQWQDSLQYDISHEDLKRSVHFIHDIRSSGKSVIVHCAQGKSRSTTAVVAYIMALKSMTSKGALEFVQEKRKMAEPNIHFVYMLSEYEKSDLLKELIGHCADWVS